MISCIIRLRLSRAFFEGRKEGGEAEAGDGDDVWWILEGCKGALADRNMIKK